MKRILGIVFVIATNWCNSQNETDVANIKTQFDYASLLLEQNTPFDALREFIKISNGNPKNDLVRISRVKTDSLLEVTRTIVKQGLKGKWQKISSYDENGEYKITEGVNSYLEITDHYFIFYRTADDTKEIIIEKKEPIMFGRFDPKFESSKYGFLFSDNSLWTITLTENAEYLSTLHIGDETPISRSVISCGGEANSYKKVN